MFADDTNLFFSNRYIKTLFQIVNQELINIHEWFKANKLSLNTGKTKYLFFLAGFFKADYIPLKYPDLKINNTRIRGQVLRWKHINIIENKISKNIGLIYKAKFLLTQKCLKSIYFSFIPSYINYSNIAWASTNQTKLKKLLNKQKHASRIIYYEDRYTHARPLMQSLNALNIYQLNIFQTLIFMFKVKNNMAPNIFNNNIKTLSHKYPTKHSKINFNEPLKTNNYCKYAISSRGPLYGTIP